MAAQPPETILVVDDDAAKRHAVTKILRRAGYAIREAETGTDALRLVAERPSLIVLDVKLPDLSGFEVCRRIKEDPATAMIPVLHLSTTFVDIEDRIYGLEGGADGYLTDVLEPLELVATVRALLRTRRAEEAAHISSKQWQATFDSVSDGVLLLDRSGKAVQCNAAMEGILGRPWNALAGDSIHDLLSISPAAHRSPFLRMLDSGRREEVELTLGDRWLRVTIDPIRDAAGVVKGGLCIASDVTDRRSMEEELRRRADELVAADRRKDEFLAMLAHELRNPLAPISNALQMIRMLRGKQPESEEALDIAARQVKHMSRLLDDLLDVARFTRGNVQLSKVPVELASVLAQAVETARPLIEGGGHQFATSFPPEPVWLVGDPTRLAQVVANLLNNAAKYTDPGGRIALTAAREGGEAVIRVRDDGVGLDAPMLARVFDLFAQEDRSLARSQGGLGIGLTLVRSLVQLHGGTVGAESRGLGQGSEFIVRLPADSHVEPTPEREVEPLGVELRRRLRLLVVDDSVDSARSLAQCLKLWGYDEVSVAHDGPSAVAVATSQPFDVIFLDIGLPGMDGYQVAERVRDQFGSAGPVLIALTGYGQAEDSARSRDVGFDEHLTKPVDLDRLRTMLGDPSFQRGRGGRRDSTGGVAGESR
ncbi:hybrid sensor histidine kinase/response regulator [Paludisphaera soli]|uniref:hybrid sensor histidine kinase/response regulator n=1 Tax=Paludisphaera soli TaxID=2712865 RepID=UPI0013EC4CE4|nr:response regulator [Paludisphaera soli]